MKDSDIEFSVGLNISPAEQNLNNLFKDTQTAHNRLQKLLNEQPSNLVYESKLRKLENIMTRYGVFSVSQANASQMPKNEFYRFQKLFNDVKAYERNERKYNDITTKVLSSVQQYQGLSAKPTPFQETFKQMYIDSKLKEREQKEIYSPKAHGMYDIWKNIVNKPTMLALPAPAQTNKAVDGEKIVTEEKIEKTEEKANKENKGVTGEIKKQHRGLLDNLANWLKIYAVIRLVHRAINTAMNLWKGFGRVSGEVFNITRDQAGNFYADPVGTMRSGIDFTRARIRAGLRAWASAGSPLLNVDAIDTASASLVAVANNAMSGNEVDKNKAIAARAVFDTLGTILNSEMLLTGNTQGYSYTDLVVDLMDKFETFMSDPEKWESLGTVKQNQFMKYIIDLLGKDIPNAVVDNVNLNKQMKDPSAKKTLLEHILGVSDSINTFGNIGQNATLASESLATFNDALAGLKRTLVNQYTPQFVIATELLTKGVKKLQGIIDEDEDKNSFFGKARNNKFRNKYFTGGEAQNDIPTTSSPKTVSDLINITMAGIPSFDETTLEAIQNEKYVNAMFDYITSGTTDYSDFKESFPEEKAMREDLKKAYEKKHGKIRLGRSEEVYKTAIESMNGMHKGYASDQEKARAEADMRIYNSWRGKQFLELALSGVELLPSDREKALQYFIESGIWQAYSRNAFGPSTTPWWSNGKTVGGQFAYNGENVTDYLFDSRFYKDTTEQMEVIRNFFKELSLKTPAFSNYQNVQWADTNKNLKIEPGELRIELSIDGQPKTYDLKTEINGSIR